MTNETGIPLCPYGRLLLDRRSGARIVGIVIHWGISNEDTTFKNDRRYNWRKPKTTRFTQTREHSSRVYRYYNTALTRWDHNRVYRCGEEIEE